LAGSGAANGHRRANRQDHHHRTGTPARYPAGGCLPRTRELRVSASRTTVSGVWPRRHRGGSSRGPQTVLVSGLPEVLTCPETFKSPAHCGLVNVVHVINHLDSGLTTYNAMDELQRDLHAEIAAGRHPNTFLLFETRSEEHTSELQSRFDLVCRL